MADETYSTDGAECPYCGHLHEAVDSDGALYSEELDEYTCGMCDKTFDLEVYVRFLWTAKPREEISN